MAKSFFRYNLSRPYPFAWFTPVLAVLILLFGTLFTLLNIAADGFNQSDLNTTNPNQTFPQWKWMESGPFSLATKLSASCQAQNLQVGSQFFTQKLSLPYTLANVYYSTTRGEQIAASLSYLNNTLDDCAIGYVQVDLEAEDRSAEQYGLSQWGAKISALAVCSVATSQGLMKVNLTTSFDLLPQTIGDGQQGSFLQLDPKSKASLWWGQSLLSAYYIKVAEAMQTIRSNASSGYIRKGAINLTPNLDKDFSSLNFFTVEYHFLGGTQSNGTVPIYFNPKQHPLLGALNSEATYPNIWSVVDIYGKSFYSAVLADLGQSSAPNVLLSSYAALLQNYTSDLGDLDVSINASPGPALGSYDNITSQGQSGPLSITPSTIYQQYRCSVPVRKPIGSLLTTVIISDLVFLNTVWMLYKLLADWLVRRKDKTADYCTEAIKQAEVSDAATRRRLDGQTESGDHLLPLQSQKRERGDEDELVTAGFISNQEGNESGRGDD